MNSEMNVFNPTMIETSRSTFSYHPTVTGTCNAGLLIPVKSIEVLPGDSIKMDLRTLVKMSTPVYPTMDQLFMDVAFYFVPNKLVLGRRYGTPNTNESNQSWAAFIGAQDNLLNMPVPAAGITLPRLYVSNPSSIGSLWDYFGYPFDKADDCVLKIDALDMLGYFAIWNENYRDENTMNPVTWSYSVDATSGLTYVVPQSYPEYYAPASASTYSWLNCVDASDPQDSELWMPFPVCRFHGYFGSALPWPQRNLVGVELPLGESAVVKTAASTLYNDATSPLKLLDVVSHSQQGAGTALGLSGTNVSSTSTSVSVSGGYDLYPSNLYADLSEATAANINALRAAIQTQRWYEHLSRSGNRLDELEFGLFGIRPHDSGDDRPLYLGGKRIPLNIEMVASTNGGTSSGAGAGAGSLGTLGAFSHTNDSDHYFYHSFDTWGKLICVMCIRHHDTFSQGLRRSLTRETREDFFWPTYAHLGEMPIRKKELYFSGTDATDNAVFGYQEAWNEYRHDPDSVTGLIRPGKSLGYMTYANNFSAAPSLVRFLNASTMVENVDKTLAVNAYAAGFQFIYQFTFDYTARRCMPTYSDPGLIDHF